MAPYICESLKEGVLYTPLEGNRRKWMSDNNLIIENTVFLTIYAMTLVYISTR